MATRVPMDRARHGGGFAVAAAAGVPASIAVVSDTDLKHWDAVGARTATLAAQKEAQAEYRQQMKHQSNARSAAWPDTVDSARRRKVEGKVQAELEAEERRKRIDAEEAALRAELSTQQVQQANLQLLGRLEQVAVAKSKVQLHNVLQEREENTTLTARAKERMRARDLALEAEELDAARRLEQREQAKAAAARERSAQAHRVCAEQVEEMKTARSARRAEERQEGLVLRARAEAESASARAQEAERRRVAREVAQLNLRQSAELHGGIDYTPRTAARHRLLTSLAQVAHAPVEEGYFKQSKLAQMQGIAERERAHKDAHEAMVQRAYQAAEAEQRKTSPRVEKGLGAGKPLSEVLLSGEDVRRARQAEGKREFIDALGTAVARSSAAKKPKTGMDPKAQRLLVDEAIELRKRDDDCEKHERRVEAMRLQKIHTLQTREKYVREAKEREKAIADGRAMLDATAADEAGVEAYVSSIGGALPPPLRPRPPLRDVTGLPTSARFRSGGVSHGPVPTDTVIA